MSAGTERRARLSADEMWHLRWALGGVVTLAGLATVPSMEVGALGPAAVAGLATVGTMLRPAWPARVPGWAHALAFPGIAGFFAVDLWLNGELLPAMVRLDIWLLLYRNISYRRRRDDFQVVALGLFLVIVAGVLAVSPAFAAQILAYTAAALALLLVVTLAEAGSAEAEPVAPGETPAWAAHADGARLLRRLRETVDWRVAALGAGLFAAVVGGTAVLFLAIPRFQIESGMFLERFVAKKTRTGFSDTIRLGDVTDIQQDNGVALSVDVGDRERVPAEPYWRMLVLNQYEGGVFRATAGFRREEFERERRDTRARGAGRAEGEPWTFYLEPGVSRYLPLPGRFGELAFREAQVFQVAPRLGLAMLREEPASMTAYRVEGMESGPALADPVFAARWRGREAAGRAEEPLARLALGETEKGALRRVVAEVGGGGEAGEFARRAAEWLRRNHGYALASRLPAGAGDPVVRWLVSREPGHCEFFAGSMVLLARAAGFPARVVTGFRGGMWNGYSNSLTIRHSDAHAWAEIFDEGTGAWLRADALAAGGPGEGGEAREEAALAARVDRSWTARWDSLRIFWYRRIVNFDQGSQVETLRTVKETARDSGRRLREAVEAMIEAARSWLAAPWSARRAGEAAGWVVGALALAWLWRRARWRGWRRGGRGVDPVRREAGRWLARIGKAETGGVREDLLRLRFGAAETWPEPGRVFRRAREEARRGGVSRSSGV